MRAIALASVFLLMLTALAAAQGQPNPEGAKLFEEGRALAKDGKYAEACAKFEKSLAIDPAIGTQLNYADCHEKQSHFAQAWRLFDAAADAEKITNPERAKFSRGRADSLLGKLGVIVLKLATPDAPMIAVSIGGRTVRAAPTIKEIVDPGDVVITVTAQNAAPFSRTEKVSAGKTITIEVPALEPTTSTIGTSPTGPGDEEPGSKRRSRLILSFAVGGAGAAALVASIFVGLKARGDYNEQFDNGNCEETSDKPACNEVGFDAMTDAISLANIGTGVGIAGIVLLGAGTALYLTAPKDDVVVTPMATATTAGISVVGRF